MRNGEAAAVTLPGGLEALSLRLPEDLEALRRRARRQQQGPRLGCPELKLIDARAWEEHSEDEDWLEWRARRVAARLDGLPIEVEPGERVVGRPRLHPPTDEERAELERAVEVLSSMPPFPGGDRGHFHPDYERLFRLGIGGMLDQIAEAAQKAGPERGAFYDACRTALEGLKSYARRVAAACRRASSGGAAGAERLRTLADVCEGLSTRPPETFHEAAQLMFLAQMALWFGEGLLLTSPGRMDRTLGRFYESDRRAGRLTRSEALEIVCSLYIQMNRVLWPGSAVAVLVGGRDGTGRDTTNDLTYLCLAASRAAGLIYPTVGLAWHRETPAELMDFAVEMLGTGAGDPAFFNDQVIRDGLREHGVSDEDAAGWVNSTCVEVKLAGASNIWVAQPYFNLPQALLEAMEPAAETDPGPESFDELLARVKSNLSAKIEREAERLDGVWRARAERGGFPLASCFVRDCLEAGRDFDRGGARYNWVENSFVGLANLADGLVAVKTLVYEEEELTLAEFHAVLERDYEGHEPLRRRILRRLPKYGNDLEAPDGLARGVAEFLIEATEAQTVGPHRYVPGFFCWVMHERLGSQTGATPDGRKAGTPLADSAGPAQGRDVRGPTASVLSTTKWNHRGALGGLVHNAKFSRKMFRSSEDRAAIRDVIETYLKRGGFEIQLNVVSADELRDARDHPERHEDLIVRVAGYCDYFTHLNQNMQDEIIARTEFGA